MSLVHPVFFGSALTGAGVDAVDDRNRGAAPGLDRRPGRAPSASVFKIERGPQRGEGRVRPDVLGDDSHARPRAASARGLEGKVTAIAVFEQGPAVQRQSVAAGAVAKARGASPTSRSATASAKSGATQRARSSRRRPSSRSSCAEQPRRSRAAPRRARAARRAGPADQRPAERTVLNEVSVSLYGEVQKEVIEATLADDFGLEVDFRETTPIHIERPLRSGEAIEVLHSETNPFLATIGLRIDPAPADSGIEFRLDIDPRYGAAVPLQDARAASRQHMARVRPRDAAGGPPRLAGHGLRRDDDQLRATASRMALRRSEARSARAATTAS